MGVGGVGVVSFSQDLLAGRGLLLPRARLGLECLHSLFAGGGCPWPLLGSPSPSLGAQAQLSPQPQAAGEEEGPFSSDGEFQGWL